MTSETPRPPKRLKPGKRRRRQEGKSLLQCPTFRFNPTDPLKRSGPSKQPRRRKSSRHSSTLKPRIVHTARPFCLLPPHCVSAVIIFRVKMSCCPGPWTVLWARETLTPNKFASGTKRCTASSRGRCTPCHRSCGTAVPRRSCPCVPPPRAGGTNHICHAP